MSDDTEPLLSDSDDGSASGNSSGGEAKALRRPFLKFLRILAISGAFMFVGPMLIMTNSYLLTARFPYPMLLCAIGVSTSGALARLAVALNFGSVSNESRAFVQGRGFWTHVAPVGLFMAASITLGNEAYLYMGVGIIQMLKAATPLLIMVVFAVAGEERPSPSVAASVAVITAGTLVTVNGAPRASVLGVSVMLFSSLAEAGRMLCTQRVITHAKLR